MRNASIFRIRIFSAPALYGTRCGRTRVYRRAVTVRDVTLYSRVHLSFFLNKRHRRYCHLLTICQSAIRGNTYYFLTTNYFVNKLIRKIDSFFFLCYIIESESTENRTHRSRESTKIQSCYIVGKIFSIQEKNIAIALVQETNYRSIDEQHCNFVNGDDGTGNRRY